VTPKEVTALARFWFDWMVFTVGLALGLFFMASAVVGLVEYVIDTLS